MQLSIAIRGSHDMNMKGEIDMVTLSAFADEISPDLDTQLNVLEEEGIRHIEFRGVWNKNVLNLSNEELRVFRETIHVRDSAFLPLPHR